MSIPMTQLNNLSLTTDPNLAICLTATQPTLSNASAEDKLLKLDLSRTLLEKADKLKALASLTHLEFLNLSGNHFGNKGLHTLVSFLPSFKNLHTLNISFTNINDFGPNREETGKKLALLTNLRHLNFSRNNILFQQVWQEFASLTNLETLNIKRTRVSGEGLQHLSTLTNLEILNLCNTNLDANAIKALAVFTKLKALDLSYASRDDLPFNALDSLTTLINLETLIINYKKLDGQRLKNLSFLKKLDLSVEKLDSQGLKELATLTKIEILNLELGSWFNTDPLPLDDQELRVLAALPNVKKLAFHHQLANNPTLNTLIRICNNPLLAFIKPQGGLDDPSKDIGNLT